MDKPKVVAITQARFGSSRFPGKILKSLGNDTILGIHLERLKRAHLIDHIVVATTDEPESKLICKVANEKKVDYFKGSLTDVLDRYYKCAVKYQPDFVVRVTSDCPLLDPELIETIITTAIEDDVDYCANSITEDFPDGQDVEVIKLDALKKAWEKSTKASDREHVTPYIKNNSDIMGGDLFKAKDFKSSKNMSHLRMTVDEPLDMDVINWLVSELGTDKSWTDYAKYMLKHPDKLVNKDIRRNAGYYKSISKD